jgi:hypothetical protein
MDKKKEDDGQVEVSLILPAYNEAGNLEKAVEEVTRTLEEITRSYQIIIAEDGSTDGTDKIGSELARKHASVMHIHSDRRLGRGQALKNAVCKAEGKILVYMDVDLATDLGQLKALVSSVREGYDFATGSRMLPESSVGRSLSRKMASKWYNFMVRTLLDSKVRDHQCGFKSCRRDSLLQILEEVTASHWFFDTELLVRASRKGYTIKEIPVDWRSGEKTTVNLLRDSLIMGSQVLKLRWKLRSQGPSNET